MQGRSEAKIPLIFRLEFVNILQFVFKGTVLISRYLGKTQWPDFTLP